MIITCPSCKKKFKIDANLIPLKGRDLQCGSCDHVWFYKIEDKTSKPLTLDNNITDNSIKTGNFNETYDKKKESEEIKKNLDKTVDIKNIHLSKQSKNITFSKFLSYLIVSIISFIAFIVLIDTLKKPLIDVFPGLEILLFNLFETLKDIKLFIIDLS
jgi:predicted Zn finger-like uncharacterized protein